MAKKTIEKFYSDLSGEEISEDYSALSFTIDGAAYEIDLTSAEKAEFEKAIQKYVDAARTVGRARSARRSSGSKSDPKAIRAWAAANSIEVPARGRIPQAVQEAYNAAR